MIRLLFTILMVIAFLIGCSDKKIPDYPTSDKNDYSAEIAAYAALLLLEEVKSDALLSGEMSGDDIDEGIKAKAEIIFLELDLDEDGIITPKELQPFIAEKLPILRPKVDKNRNNVIDAEELALLKEEINLQITLYRTANLQKPWTEIREELCAKVTVRTKDDDDHLLPMLDRIIARCATNGAVGGSLDDDVQKICEHISVTIATRDNPTDSLTKVFHLCENGVFAKVGL